LVEGNAEHPRDAGAEDVGVDEADPASALGERYREVDGDRRFPDPTLAAGDGEDVANPWKLVALGFWR